MVDRMGDAERDVVDLPINKKNKHHKISPSPAREKGNDLVEGADSDHEKVAKKNLLGQKKTALCYELKLGCVCMVKVM